MADANQIVTVIGRDISTVSTSNQLSLNGYDVERTFQATLTGTGALTATVVIEVSNDGVGWLSDATSTLSLSGTNLASGGFSSSASWGYVRANVTAISGTGAKVTVTVGG